MTQSEDLCILGPFPGDLSLMLIQFTLAVGPGGQSCTLARSFTESSSRSVDGREKGQEFVSMAISLQGGQREATVVFGDSHYLAFSVSVFSKLNLSTPSQAQRHGSAPLPLALSCWILLWCLSGQESGVPDKLS